MPREPTITIHAIRRFAERVMGVRLEAKGDRAALAELREVHKVDTEAIETVLTGIVRRGVAAGASAVILRRTRFVLEGRRLVTVTAFPKRRRRKGRIDRDED